MDKTTKTVSQDTVFQGCEPNSGTRKCEGAIRPHPGLLQAARNMSPVRDELHHKDSQEDNNSSEAMY